MGGGVCRCRECAIVEGELDCAIVFGGDTGGEGEDGKEAHTIDELGVYVVLT